MSGQGHVCKPLPGLSMNAMLSPEAISNLYTKAATSRKDVRQKLPTEISIPDEPTRRLLARLILEEAFEAVTGLGFKMTCENVIELSKADPDKEALWGLTLHGCLEPNLIEIIDGCCDLRYVAAGAMVACGVPDLEHLKKVCSANNNKFPGGIATINEHTGKYEKPSGWKEPDHQAIIDTHAKQGVNLNALGETLIEVAQELDAVLIRNQQQPPKKQEA